MRNVYRNDAANRQSCIEATPPSVQPPKAWAEIHIHKSAYNPSWEKGKLFRSKSVLESLE